MSTLNNLKEARSCTGQAEGRDKLVPPSSQRPKTPRLKTHLQMVSSSGLKSLVRLDQLIWLSSKPSVFIQFVDYQ
jgi:hypothetical protein